MAFALGRRLSTMAIGAFKRVAKFLALPTEPIPHASVARQREKYGFTEEHITKVLQELREEE